MFDLMKTIQKVKIEDIAEITIKMNEKDDVEEVEYFLHSLDVLYSIANNQKLKLDSKTLYNVRMSLEDMGLIKKIEMGKYSINDIFLKIYLQQDGNDIELIDFKNTKG